MEPALDSAEVISSLLLVKAVLAVLATLLFIYYKFYWDKAKRHLAVHFFFAKWRAVRHAVILGLAAAGFAVGFTLELFGTQLGLSENMARGASSIFEIGSLFSMLFVFFQLAMDDVPHFQHIAESTRHHHRRLPEQEASSPTRTAVRVDHLSRRRQVGRAAARLNRHKVAEPAPAAEKRHAGKAKGKRKK